MIPGIRAAQQARIGPTPAPTFPLPRIETPWKAAFHGASGRTGLGTQTRHRKSGIAGPSIGRTEGGVPRRLRGERAWYAKEAPEVRHSRTLHRPDGGRRSTAPPGLFVGLSSSALPSIRSRSPDSESDRLEDRERGHGVEQPARRSSHTSQLVSERTRAISLLSGISSNGTQTLASRRPRPK